MATTTDRPTKDYSTILFTPEEAGVQTSAYLRDRRENKGMGIRVGIASMDKVQADKGVFLPLMPGELMSIIARPGNAKTGFMVRWARTRANWLKEQKIEDRAVVYITLEQSIEELNAFNLAAERQMSITSMAMGEITDEEWRACLEYGISRRFWPLWNIGYSSMTEKKQIRIDLEGIAGALNLIRTQYKKTIDLVFVDYLQRIPYDRAESKTIGVSDSLDALKTLALRLRCPVVVGVQAKREVDEKAPPIPDLDDGQWTSNVEQSSDRVISLVRPRNYRQEGEEFGKTRVEGSAQLLVSVLKQKLGPIGFNRWLYFDPIYNKLDELENHRN